MLLSQCLTQLKVPQMLVQVFLGFTDNKIVVLIMTNIFLLFVGMVVNDQNYGKLSAAIESGALKAGFEAAHALKGVLGNLSLTPIYEPVSKLTEMLRHPENGEDYRPLYDEVMKQKALLEELSAKGA